MTVQDFGDCIKFSQGRQLESDMKTIQSMLVGCTSVVKTPKEDDRTGVDYIATLRGGREVPIDAKRRRRGCSTHWKGEPELALEMWSVMPGGEFRTPPDQSKTGWTLNEASRSELILYVWDPSDTDKAYLLPFQLLRIAFRANYFRWPQLFKVGIQKSWHRERPWVKWQSKAVFVPFSVVWDAIQLASQGLRLWPAASTDDRPQCEQTWLAGF